jgi:hypothetical protein
MPYYMDNEVTDAYVQELVTAYRDGYTESGGEQVEESDQIVLDMLAANETVSPRAPSAYAVGAAQAENEAKG